MPDDAPYDPNDPDTWNLVEPEIIHVGMGPDDEIAEFRGGPLDGTQRAIHLKDGSPPPEMVVSEMVPAGETTKELHRYVFDGLTSSGLYRYRHDEQIR